MEPSRGNEDFSVEAFELNSLVESKASDWWREGDNTVVTVHVYGPKQFPRALKDTLAQVRALITLGTISGDFDNYKSMFTSKDVQDLARIHAYDVFEEPTDWFVSQLPERLLEENPPETYNIVGYTIVIEDAP